MNISKQKILFNEFVEKQRSLLESKGHDYANEDVLSNFKKVGAVTGNGATGAVLNLIATKVVRLANLLEKGADGKHESLEDTLVDLSNYSFLASCILNERKEDQLIIAIAKSTYNKHIDAEAELAPANFSKSVEEDESCVSSNSEGRV